MIKKSRFIGKLWHVETEQEAKEIIEANKKECWDATHNCYAMVIGKQREFMRMSDDGEPQGTAGVPMLEALKMSGLTDVLAIVTRYFGGVLLGAGRIGEGVYEKASARLWPRQEKSGALPRWCSPWSCPIRCGAGRRLS